MKIFGITPQEAKQVFGEPIDSLSGLSGDIFKWKNKTKVIAYYDSDNLGNMIVDDKATIDKPVETVDAIGEEVSNNKNVFYGYNFAFWCIYYNFFFIIISFWNCKFLFFFCFYCNLLYLFRL